MSKLSFEWDPDKNTESVRNHGISFEEAKTVFTDQYARLIADPDHSPKKKIGSFCWAPVSAPGYWWFVIAQG